ncbi:hypothetical protein RJ640_012765 [Escallonia rubra]|uniref:Exonuclease 1 n=1 Tax=Escallonia rubra TaxID=112253 RepID=A0AA88RHN2_9ASTE|nr:hypothetical protein RJ640_012765 [Escallonia rubra]
MGIQGLLPLLKSIMAPIHIKDIQGCSVAVDTYSWLHKGALSCSKDLCKGNPTSKHIDYCMHRVNLLRHYGVRPVLVFDGGFLPMKIEQENKRLRSRKENHARAIEHESCGNSAAAYECYQKAVDISPSVAYELIQVLKQENVYYVVAPYEADAQMTFLAVSKQVDAVITEDSDLIAFGCPRIIYKMDKFGQGVEFRYSLLQQNKELNFTNFTKQMLLEMCILSGCDYLQSLPGMGLKKSYALINKFRSYDKVLKHLKYSGIAVSPLYEEFFKKALLTFQHQRVFDPVTEDIVHLSDLSDQSGEDLDFLGPYPWLDTSIPRDIAKGIARGDLDPITKMPFQEESARAELVLDGNYQLNNFKPESDRKKLDLPAQKNLLTNYFCFASLEAKRTFRAPRITPKEPSPSGESPSSGDDINEEAKFFNTMRSPASLPDCRTLDVVTPAKENVGNCISARSSQLLEPLGHGVDKENLVNDTGSPDHSSLQQPRPPMRPCRALHKERECNSASDLGEGKTRTGDRSVVVRSSYFQHKSLKGNNQFSEKENVLSKDDASCGTWESTLLKGESQSAKNADDGKTRNVKVRSTYCQEKSINGIDKEELLRKDGAATDAHQSTVAKSEGKSSSEAVEGKTRVENRKVIVSSYFQHKSRKESDVVKKQENLLVKDCDAIDACENTRLESASCNNYNDDTILKRKVAPIDNVQIENTSHKYRRSNASLPIQTNCTSNLIDSVADTEDGQGKFGCNISHLGKYSDIAGKSMENFVSVISSFRCSSSGSRASGLRAPLRDVQNTFPRRHVAYLENHFVGLLLKYRGTMRKCNSSFSSQNPLLKVEGAVRCVSITVVAADNKRKLKDRAHKINPRVKSNVVWLRAYVHGETQNRSPDEVQ